MLRTQLLSNFTCNRLSDLKRYFSQWQLRKNATKDDVLYMAMVIRDLGVGCEKSERPTFEVYGRKYNYYDIQRSLRRWKLSFDSLRDPVGIQPDHIQIRSPDGRKAYPQTSGHDGRHEVSPGSRTYNERPDALAISEAEPRLIQHLGSISFTYEIPHSPLPPLNFYKHEKLFTNIKAYIRGAFDSEMFTSINGGELVNSHAPTSSVKLKDFYWYCFTAIRLLENGHMVEGFSWFTKAQDLVEDLLVEQDPKLLETLLDVSMLLHIKGFTEIYQALCEYVCGLVAMKTNPEHPWAQIFSQVGKLAGPQFLSTMELSWRCGYDTFTRAFGTFHADNIICYTNFIARTYDEHDAKQRLNRFLGQALQETRNNSHVPEVKYACGYGLFRLGEYRKTLKYMSEVISTCNRAKKWELEISAREVLAQCWDKIMLTKISQAEIKSAEVVLEEAIGRSHAVYGLESARALGLETIAWEWLWRQGRNAEAETIRRRINSCSVLRTDTSSQGNLQ